MNEWVALFFTTVIFKKVFWFDAGDVCIQLSIIAGQVLFTRF